MNKNFCNIFFSKINIKEFAYFYIVSITILLFFMGKMRELWLNCKDKRAKYTYPSCVIFILYMSITVWFDCAFLDAFYGKIKIILLTMGQYVAVTIALILMVFRFYKRIKDKSRQQKNNTLFVVAAFVLLLLCLSLYTYTFSVYQIVPRNRGGRYPMVEYQVTCSNSTTSKVLQQSTKDGWLFLAGENEQSFYFEEPYSLGATWEELPQRIVEVRKDTIELMVIRSTTAP